VKHPLPFPAIQARKQAHLLVKVDDVRVAVGLDAVGAPLATDTGLLVATEDGLGSGLLEGVDEDGAGFEAAGDALGVLDVLAPNTGTETGVGVVGALDDLLLVGPRLGGHDGAEGLFGDDAAVVRRVVDNSRLDKEALLGRGGVLANSELVAVLLGVREELLDLLVLHLVLNGAEEGAGVGAADLDGLGEVDHLLDELGVDALVNVDSLGGDTDWPEFWKAPMATWGATFFTSTSGRMMEASLPPSSRVQRLRVLAQAAMIFLPVAMEPVKEILAIPG